MTISAQDIAEALERLSALRNQGAISAEDFETLKQKLIQDRIKAPLPGSDVQRGSTEEPVWGKLASKRATPAIVIAAIAIGVFAIPLTFEGVSNECSAVESYSLAKVQGQANGLASNGMAMGIITLMQRASNGAIASAAAKERTPYLPPALSCTIAYYRVLLNGMFSSSATPSAPSPSVPSTPAFSARPLAQPNMLPNQGAIPNLDTPRGPPKKRAKTIAPEIPTEQIVPDKLATPPAPPVPADDPLVPVTRTHTLPPYPSISARLGEQGTTAMTVQVDAEGTVTSCKVTVSSGSERLDAAAWNIFEGIGGGAKGVGLRRR